MAFPLVNGVTSAGATAATPMQLPFPCGERWYGKSYTGGGHAHNAYAIDFNGSPSDGDGDQGRRVVAAAGGKVIRSVYETGNGFGNVVVIRHADGTTALYAHLKSRSVSTGASVGQGQSIGTVGKTSAKYKMGAHLHFEHRTSGGGGIAARFNGAGFAYNGRHNAVVSRNCGGGTQNSTPDKPSTPAGSSNPYSPEKVCGSGFRRIDAAPLGSAGTVHLLYNSATGENCVTTVRSSGSGKVAMTAYLEAKGKARGQDKGSFQYYAGPVKTQARGICVKWGGSIGSAAYNSQFEHCKA
ncbi:M23 family metallopeptidase [Nonomuraea longicatena]|uniref:M23 family metallopeptidase n=1 Tax=Nonomuraea longicatena TaxID=83682 RepID=A0ABP3ZK44_9ACTN